MIITFLLTYKIFESKNIIKLKQRFERLAIPYIIVPFIYFFLLFKSFYLNGNIKILIFDLLKQYITGHTFYGFFWFIHNLILFTLFFCIIFLIVKKYSLYILQLLALTSYWLQYNELNFFMLNKYSETFIAIQRINEMFPIAVTGLSFGSYEILKKLKKYKIKTIIFDCIFFYFIYNYNIFGYFRGFIFKGFKNNVGGICLVIFFSLLPIEKINNKIIIYIIRTISKYSGGIYYYQKIIYYFLCRIIYLRYRYFLTCFIIYISGYLVCFIGTKIFRNNKIKYLFN